MSLYQRPMFLTKEHMEKIHETSLKLLERKGVVFQSEKAREILSQHGARVDGEIVFMPRELIENSLKTVPDSFRVDAINQERSVQVGGKDSEMVIHPAGGEVFIKEADNSRIVSTTIKQFSDLQKLYQACDNINMTGYQPLSPEDVPMQTRGLHCLYETMLYTDKPWLMPMDYTSGENKRRELDMYGVILGKDWMKNHYMTWSIVTPESPLVYSEFSCESIIEFADYNQPVALVSAPMSGITGPYHLMGTIVLAVAESMAGLCLAQCVNPGIPVLPSASLTYGNLQHATWECASPETALMLAGFVQMFKEYYKMPTRAQTGVTSSKCLDYQAGYETMQSLLLTAFLGVDVTSQSAGSLENLMTVSFEKTLIDDEVISRVRRIIHGLDTDDEAFSFDIIMEVNHGKDFLMHDSTLDNFDKSWKPFISDWNDFDRWDNLRFKEIEERAAAKVRDIISAAEPLISDADAKALAKYISDFE